MTRRLIEEWLPIAELSEESVRERRSMTALPPTYYLHVWWARRPLVACRAAILAALLPADADRKRFLHMLGIHGDPVAARQRIAKANAREDGWARMLTATRARSPTHPTSATACGFVMWRSCPRPVIRWSSIPWPAAGVSRSKPYVSVCRRWPTISIRSRR